MHPTIPGVTASPAATLAKGVIAASEPSRPNSLAASDRIVQSSSDCSTPIRNGACAGPVPQAPRASKSRRWSALESCRITSARYANFFSSDCPLAITSLIAAIFSR